MKLSKAYGDCIGPLGFPMKSAAAKLMEKLLAEQPDECKEISTEIRQEDGSVQVVKGYGRKVSFPEKFEFDKDERADVSLITSDAKDRDGEVMLPGGGNFKEFKKNPIVPFAHRYDALPVGRSLWMKRVKPKGGNGPDGWIGKTQYSSKPDDWSGDWFPDAVFHMVTEGILRGKSIGFIPMKMHKPIPEEIEKRSELADVRWIIETWEALEYSVAPVQSNPDAVVVQVAKMKDAGIKVPDEVLEEMGLMLFGDPDPIDYKQIEDVEPKDVVATARKLTEAENRKYVSQRILKEIKSIDVKALVQEQLDLAKGKV